MSDKAQIQHHGCLQAGSNPYNPIVRSHTGDGSQFDVLTHGTIANRSYVGRCMMSTIASLTRATVFVSSDLNGLRYEPNGCDEYNYPHFSAEGDMVLEFGVDRDGRQVDCFSAFHTNSTSGSSLWNPEKFPHFDESIQNNSDGCWTGAEIVDLGKYYLDKVETWGEQVPEGQPGQKYPYLADATLSDPRRGTVSIYPVKRGFLCFDSECEHETTHEGL